MSRGSSINACFFLLLPSLYLRYSQGSTRGRCMRNVHRRQGRQITSPPAYFIMPWQVPFHALCSQEGEGEGSGKWGGPREGRKKKKRKIIGLRSARGANTRHIPVQNPARACPKTQPICASFESYLHYRKTTTNFPRSLNRGQKPGPNVVDASSRWQARDIDLRT